jgi:hypothetical protein
MSKVKLGWSALTIPQKIVKANSVVATTKANPDVYVTPDPPLEEIETAACQTCLCDVPNLGEFPLCEPSGSHFQGLYGGGDSDGFFAKFSSSMNLVWSTYYGGMGIDQVNDLDLEAVSDRVLFAATSHTQTLSMIQYTEENGPHWHNQSDLYGPSDALIGMFEYSTNDLIWGAYFGYFQTESGNAIAVNGDDNDQRFYYLAGSSTSPDYQQYGSYGSPPAWYGCCPNAETIASSLSPRGFIMRCSAFGHYMSVEEMNNTGSTSGFLISAYPNPTYEDLIVSMDIHQRQNVSIEIYSVGGHLIKRIPINNVIGNQEVTIPFNTYATGVYVIRLAGETGSQALKVIKQ